MVKYPCQVPVCQRRVFNLQLFQSTQISKDRKNLFNSQISFKLFLIAHHSVYAHQRFLVFCCMPTGQGITCYITMVWCKGQDCGSGGHGFESHQGQHSLATLTFLHAAPIMARSPGNSHQA